MPDRRPHAGLVSAAFCACFAVLGLSMFVWSSYTADLRFALAANVCLVLAVVAAPESLR